MLDDHAIAQRLEIHENLRKKLVRLDIAQWSPP
jgi:hypothetical protein